MIKKVIKFRSNIFPRATAFYAYKTLTNPQQKKIRQHETDVLSTANKKQISFKKFDIQLYNWGNPKNEMVLLVHGWEGHSGNFASIIGQLLQHDYYILAFDGPSHGFSTKGQTNLLEFSDLIIQILKKYNPKKIISHSFGAVVTTYALKRSPHLEIDKYVMITTPDSFLERVNYISDQIGIAKNARRKLIRKLESELKTNIDEVSVSKFVKNVQVKDALILHGRDDKIIPLQQARIVHKNWPSSNLEVIENTGH
nr:alpha/beta hydrolase [uncultured Flavobacterium sp.]